MTSPALPSAAIGRIGLFGASSAGRQALRDLATRGLRPHCFLDNDQTRCNTMVDGVPVLAPTAEVIGGLDVVWVTSVFGRDIGRQLDGLGVRTRVAWSLDDLVQTTTPPEVAIVIADEGWILERCARAIEDRLPYVRVSAAPIAGARLTYYVNYSARRTRVSPIEIAFFTHVEESVPAAAARFFEVGREVDVAVAMSERYAAMLRSQGASDVRVITPGVDLDRFQPAIRIGVVGRTYHTGRKGEALVKAVLDTPHVEWHFTGDGWPLPARRLADEELPAFYRSMDYILVPALYEGGPMPVLEALACGVEVIAPRVGFVDDYPHIEFEAGNAADLRRVLEELVEQRLARRRSVEMRTWDAWAAQHDVLFRELLAKVPQSLPSPPAIATPAASVAAPRPDRLRVLLAQHAPEAAGGTGGPAVRVPRMREALAAHGIDADVSTDALPDPSGYDLVHVFNVWEPVAAERQLRHLRSSGVPVVFSPILLDLYESLWAQRTIVPLMRSQRSAHEIDAELATLAETPAPLRQALGAAVSEFWEQWPATVRTLVGLADRIVVLSEHERGLLDRFGALTVPTSLVHNGVDLSIADDASPDLLAAEIGVRDYVLSVGRIEPRKNQLMLAHALRDTDLHLVLVGDTPKPDYADLVKAALPGRVHLVPHLRRDDPRLASAYAGARVFALPSWSEGMPLAALEAAAFGLPLVLSDRSGEREYLGPLATYVDPGRIDRMRAAILEAWTVGAEPGTRRDEARGWIDRALTWDHAARETARAYADTLKAARRETQYTAPGPRKLEIGSGMAPQRGYEHLDARADLPDIDHVADIRRALPFPDGTFDVVMSRSCIEHVSWREVQDVLREWGRILKPGGELEVWTPDFEYLCRQYLARKDDRHLHPTLVTEAETYLGGYDSAAWAIIKMFGGQDYPENFHGAVLDEELLTRVLEAAGFERVERHEPFWGLRLKATRSLPFTPRAEPTEMPAPARAETQLPSLAWDGPLFNVSGYAALGRHVLRALITDGVDVRLRSRDDEPKMRADAFASSDRWMWMRGVRRQGQPRVHVTCCTPTDWQGNSVFAQRKRERPGCEAYVGVSMFETDALPAGWAEACNELTEVWVPSQFARTVFEESGVAPNRLQVMPVGLDTARYDPATVTALDVPGRRGFMFLSVFDWTLRKGWDVLIEAYATAFRASDDVCLVLRTASRSPHDVPAAAIAQVFERLGVPADERPTVILLDTPVSDDAMPGLYRAADAFVLPTRGEGWGLTLMEAMAAGLPTIATRWGGQLDFMNDDNAWLIDVEALVPVADEQTRRSPYYTAAQRWAQPSVTHTAALMRRAFDHRADARALGRRARASIEASWTPVRTTRWVRERLERLAPDPDVALARARRADASGRVEDALDLYRVATRGPLAAVALYNRASLLKRLDRRNQAAHVFRQVLRTSDPALRAGGHFHLGELSARSGHFDEAHEHFAACLALTPDHKSARAWHALDEGRRHERAGDLRAAATAYTEACALRDDWMLATYNLASVAARLGDTTRAEALFREVASRTSDVGQQAGACFHLARLQQADGRVAEAAAHIEACLAAVPDHRGALALRERWQAPQA